MSGIYTADPAEPITAALWGIKGTIWRYFGHNGSSLLSQVRSLVLCHRREKPQLIEFVSWELNFTGHDEGPLLTFDQKSSSSGDCTIRNLKTGDV